MRTTEEEIQYNVVCDNCGQVFTPGFKTPLWWRAKKASDSGRLDAIYVSGKDCGCVEPQSHPEAPFRVFGHGSETSFDLPRWTFCDAIKTYRVLNRSGHTVFISGVSDAVSDALFFGR